MPVIFIKTEGDDSKINRSTSIRVGALSNKQLNYNNGNIFQFTLDKPFLLLYYRSEFYSWHILQVRLTCYHVSIQT